MDRLGMFDMELRQLLYNKVSANELNIAEQDVRDFQIQFRENASGNLVYYIHDFVYDKLTEDQLNEIEQLWQSILNRR